MTGSISLRNVGKCYKIYQHQRDRLMEWLSPFSSLRHTEKWVLKEINLDIMPGEAVGIIGMNGAGKSTLLKIITGTTLPSTGEVHYDGTISALLELGIGFHPDFTGRQNVYMSGQLMGYSPKEIDDCMEKIEDFAEIGDAIDAPVRTYSSGMQVRLAFSVATMKRPDILIVDEALSVGDTYFQHKSFARIKKFRDKGTTLLLVSHDSAAIEAVCDRAVLLNHGKMIRSGNPEEIMNFYNAMLSGDNNKPIQQNKLDNGRLQVISGNGDAHLQSIKLINKLGQKVSIADVGEIVTLIVDTITNNYISELTCGMMLKNRLGEAIFGTNTKLENQSIRNLQPGELVRFKFIFPLNVGEGNYSITVALHEGEDNLGKSFEWCDLACIFEVVNKTKKRFTGYAYLNAKVISERR